MMQKRVTLFFLFLFFFPALFLSEDTPLLNEEFENQYQFSLEAYQKEKYHTAQQSIETFLLKQPNYVEAHILKAKILARRGKVDKALNYLTSLYSIKKEAAYIATRGLILFENNYFFSAFEDVLFGFEEQYESFDFFWGLFLIRNSCQAFTAEETKLYKEYCQELHKIDPGYLLDKAVEFDATKPEVWQEKALFEIHKKDFQNALQSIDLALLLDDTSPRNYQVKSILLIRENKLEEALGLLQDHSEKIQETNWYTKLKIDIYYALKQNEQVEQVLLDDIRTYPKKAENYFLLSEHYIQVKYYNKAVKYLKRYLSFKPNDLTARNVLAKILWQQKKFDAIIPQLQYLVDHGFNELFPYQSLARLLLIKEQVFSAEKVILKGFYRNVNYHNNFNHVDAQLLFEYALIQEKKLNYQDAIKIYQKLYQIDDKKINYAKRLGISYFYLQDYHNSIHYLEKALQIQSTSTIQYYLVQNYIALKENEKALTSINQLIAEEPEQIEYYFIKSQIEFQNKDYHNSLGSINKALNLDTKNARLKQFESRILFHLQEFELAEQSLSEALDLDKNDFNAKKRLLFLKFKNKKTDTLDLINHYLNNNEPDLGIIELKNYLTGAYRDLWNFNDNSDEEIIFQAILQSEFEKAASLIEKEQKNNPHNNRIIHLSILLSSLHPFDIKYIENIDVTNTDWSQVYYALYEKVKTKESIAILERMFKENKNAYISGYLADLYYEKKNNDQALSYLKEYVKEYPDNDWANLKIAIIYDFKKQHREAIAIYNQILSQNPNHELALNNLAWLYLTTDNKLYQNTKDALVYSKKAVAIAPTNAASLDTLAEAFFQTKQYEKALATIEKAMLYDRENLDHFKKQRRKIEKKLFEKKKK